MSVVLREDARRDCGSLYLGTLQLSPFMTSEFVQYLCTLFFASDLIVSTTYVA
jgi:hypothetical protein